MYRFILVMITLVTLTSASFFRWAKKAKSLQSTDLDAIFNERPNVLIFDFDEILLPQASTSQGRDSKQQDVNVALSIISKLINNDKATQVHIITKGEVHSLETFKDHITSELLAGDRFILAEENGRTIWSYMYDNSRLDWDLQRYIRIPQTLTDEIEGLAKRKGVQITTEDMGHKTRIFYPPKAKQIMRDEFGIIAQKWGYETKEVDDTSLDVKIYNKRNYVANLLQTGKFKSAISFSYHSDDEGIHQAMNEYGKTTKSHRFISVSVGDKSTERVAKYRLKNLDDLKLML